MSWLNNMPGVKDIVYGLVTMPRRAKLKFTGAGVTVTDDGAQCVVTIPGGGGGGGGGYEEAEVVATGITGTLDNYNPSGWADATCLVLEGNGTINAFAAPGDGKPMFRRLLVTGTSSVISIAHEAASSTAANRVVCPSPYGSSLSRTITLFENMGAWLVYNVNESRWQLVVDSITDRHAVFPLYISGTSLLGPGAWLATSSVQVAASGPGPYVIQGITAPAASQYVKSGVKLVQFSIVATIKHEDVSAPATARFSVTSGADWVSAIGDYALMTYEVGVQRWVLHPLKTAAAPNPGTTNATARTFASSVTQTWTSGSATPTFTFSTGSAVNGVEETIFFPASTLTTITLSSDLDPTGTVTYTFDDALAAYVLHMKYLGTGPCIVSTMRKVTDL